MDKSLPGRFSRASELSQQLLAGAQLDAEILAILEEMSADLYACREDNRRLKASLDACNRDIGVLRKQYSEVLYKLSDLRQASQR